MLSSLNKIPKTILLLSSLSLLCSCISNKSDEVNSNFLKQYGDNIEKINSQRDEMEMPAEQKQSNKNWKDPKEIFNIENSESARSSFIDTSQIVMPKPPEDFLPNRDTLIQGQAQQLPEDMFSVSYNMQNFPDSYGRPRLSFDDIAVPNRDAFGVETELGEKNYQLINHKTLQKDVDFTKQLSSKEDREISYRLIEEEKQAKRRAYLNQKTGNKISNKADDKKTDDDKKDEKKISDKTTSDNINKEGTTVLTKTALTTNQTPKQQ